MKLQPVGRSLLVKLKEPERKSVLLLTRQLDEPMHAVVEGVGERVEAPIKEGDTVLLFPYAGAKITPDKEESPYLIVGEKDIIGIVRE